MLAGRHYSETVYKCKNFSTTDGKVKWILQVRGERFVDAIKEDIEKST